MSSDFRLALSFMTESEKKAALEEEKRNLGPDVQPVKTPRQLYEEADKMETELWYNPARRDLDWD